MDDPKTSRIDPKPHELDGLSSDWNGTDLSVLLTLHPGPHGALYSRHVHSNFNGSIYGGQLLGQVLQAASRDVAPERAANSLHLNFLAAGRPAQRVRYEVRRLMEGRTFSARHVAGLQGDRLIVSATVSFHAAEAGPGFQCPMPEVPGPEGLVSMQEIAQSASARLGPVMSKHLGSAHTLDFRPLKGDSFLFERDPAGRFQYWLRVREPLPDQVAMHQAALAYMSDYWLLSTTLLPHMSASLRPSMRVSSLAHALHLQRPVRADEWLLFDAETPSSANARGVVTARVFHRSGELVATVMQEGLMRTVAPPTSAARPATGSPT